VNRSHRPDARAQRRVRAAPWSLHGDPDLLQSGAWHPLPWGRSSRRSHHGFVPYGWLATRRHVFLPLTEPAYRQGPPSGEPTNKKGQCLRTSLFEVRHIKEAQCPSVPGQLRPDFL